MRKRESFAVNHNVYHSPHSDLVRQLCELAAASSCGQGGEEEDSIPWAVGGNIPVELAVGGMDNDDVWAVAEDSTDNILEGAVGRASSPDAVAGIAAASWTRRPIGDLHHHRCYYCRPHRCHLHH